MEDSSDRSPTMVEDRRSGWHRHSTSGAACSYATPEQKKVPGDFIKGHLPAGNGEVDTDIKLREELDKQRFIQVSLRLESSDQTQRRQVNALSILQRAQKLDPNPLPGARARWVDCPILEQWQSRLCNKSQIPDSAIDVLEGASQYLTHLSADDHLSVIKYLRAVPTLYGIALGIIQGRAGVGKTYVIASVVTAILRANPNKKILILTPSNEPCDVVMRKIHNEMQKYPETKDLIAMRAHNVAAEKNYVVAHAKLATLQAKIAADKLKTTAELKAEKERQILINQKKARDAEAEAQEKKLMLAKVAKNMPVRRPKQSTSGAEDIIILDMLSDSEPESDDEPDVDSDVVMNAVLPDLIQKFNDEVVVSEGCFRADESIDVERLERDQTLGKAHAGLRLATYLSKFMAPGDRLIHDPRFQEIQQSLAWTILVVAGVLHPITNKFTDMTQWTAFRVLFNKFVEEGDYMDEDERKSLDNAMKELRQHCVSISSVLGSTENNIASGLYTQNFPAKMVIVDEANRSLITDTCIAIAHFEPTTLICVGDPQQLRPVVTGPTPLTGFLKELNVSTMRYFSDPGWPFAQITIQRRSRAGIVDIPCNRFYFAKAINGPNAHNDNIFFHTKKVCDIVHKVFKDKTVQRSPVMYFEVEGSQAHVDPITKSRYNLQIASCVMNMVELFQKNGIPPIDQGIITPYMAQVQVYKYAAHQLHLANPTFGFNRLLIGTADSMEGEERPVMHTDTVVTHEIGFIDGPGRILVMTTRGGHAAIVYGSTKSLYQTNRYIRRIVANLISLAYLIQLSRMCRRSADSSRKLTSISPIVSYKTGHSMANKEWNFRYKNRKCKSWKPSLRLIHGVRSLLFLFPWLLTMNGDPL
jgi:hypothetical protein